jgi:LuxR family maltose regulon positive regulatory protein
MSRSRQLAAIMFTDIVGYTALMQQNEKKAIQARNKHRSVFNSITKKYNGKILQYYGDGTLSIFDSAIEAVKCSIEMQLSLQKEPSIPVRIGIHSGDIIFNEEEIIGDSVNVASRIESLSIPGSVFISDKVYDEIKNQEYVKTIRLKSFKLKNVEEPLDIYAISNDGLNVPKPEEYEEKLSSPLSSLPESQLQSEFADDKDGSLTTILATKLFIPPPRPKLVPRPRLTERLKRGLAGKLTLISAPAGFGKTTLISECIDNDQYHAAWISLDEEDNDQTRFLSYLIASIQTIDVNIGKRALGFLQLSQPPPIESILTTLLNEIAIVKNNFILVLDDYHVIDSEPIDQGLTFLLDHLPPQLHVVITTRKDPNLPLPRFRVRSQLTELRATDLRFTPSEATDFFNQAMDLNLSVDDIERLESRTEGWIAGLQLAALSIEGRDDKSGFIQAFAGHDRYVVDYLVEEVLKGQSENIRSFLLQTSILNRLSGPLCDAVTQRKDSKKMLDILERSNLFIVSLDDKREWFRYHHLFADVLHAHSKDEHPDHIPNLHLKASEWFEKNDFPADAIRHALAARNYERAAALIEQAWPEMESEFQDTAWLNWANALPEELFTNRPVLNVAKAWALLTVGDVKSAEKRLNDAADIIESSKIANNQSDTWIDSILVADEKQYRFLPSSMAMARAYIAQIHGDIPATVELAHQALDLLPEEDHLRNGAISALLGLAHWTNGDLDTAYQTFSTAINNMRIGGNILFALSANYGLAELRIAQGQLQEAIHIYDETLQFVTKEGGIFLMIAASMELGLSELIREKGDLEKASQHLLKSREYGAQSALPDWHYRYCLAESRMLEIQGDFNKAIQKFQKAEELYFKNPMPDVRPLPAIQARLWIRQGRLDKVQNWVREQNLSTDMQLSYLKEYEHITLARFLIAQYISENKDSFLEKTIDFLKRLLSNAENGNRIGSQIEILILLSIVSEIHGDTQQSLESLERALNLARPENYIQVFLDEGQTLVELLEKILASKSTDLSSYVEKLISAFRVSHHIVDKHGLSETLSERELEVLRLLDAGLSNKQIMEDLFLSLSTVKTHIRNLYSKLEVHSRTEAIKKAREIDLL